MSVEFDLLCALMTLFDVRRAEIDRTVLEIDDDSVEPGKREHLDDLDAW